MYRQLLLVLLLVLGGSAQLVGQTAETRLIAQSRSAFWIFDPWTEEERAFYPTFRISDALKALHPLEAEQRKLYQADTLLDQQITDMQHRWISLLADHNVTKRFLQEGRKGKNINEATPHKIQASIDDVQQQMELAREKQQDLRYRAYSSQEARQRLDSLDRWYIQILRSLLPFYGTWKDEQGSMKLTVELSEEDPQSVRIKTQLWQRDYVFTSFPVPSVIRWGKTKDATQIGIGELEYEGQTLRASLLYANAKAMRMEEAPIVLRLSAEGNRLFVTFQSQEHQLHRVEP